MRKLAFLLAGALIVAVPVVMSAPTEVSAAAKAKKATAKSQTAGRDGADRRDAGPGGGGGGAGGAGPPGTSRTFQGLTRNPRYIGGPEGFGRALSDLGASFSRSGPAPMREDVRGVQETRRGGRPARPAEVAPRRGGGGGGRGSDVEEF